MTLRFAITDVRMPEMDGIAVTQALRRTAELARIVMTAFVR